MITNVILNAGAFAEWQAQTLSFHESARQRTRLPGKLHDRSQKDCAEQRKMGQSNLRSVREDVEDGYLTDIRTLISADVFTDFLEMAEHLDDNGYKDPTAYPTGAVLEDVCE